MQIFDQISTDIVIKSAQGWFSTIISIIVIIVIIYGVIWLQVFHKSGIPLQFLWLGLKQIQFYSILFLQKHFWQHTVSYLRELQSIRRKEQLFPL